MYAPNSSRSRTARRACEGGAPLTHIRRSALVGDAHPTKRIARVASLLLVAACLCNTAWAQEAYHSPAIVRKISGLSEKLELTTNSSRILTLDKNIPRVQVNNPELLAVTPLSATQIQISAKKAGVTQVNLWDEDGNIHTVDVLIYGDARELEVALQTQFPHSSIKVYRYSESLVLKGFVDRPDYVSQIMRLAEDYAPKVINNINVGGVQQVLLRVKVMEISRTKLRRLGVDWGFTGDNGSFVLNSINDILSRDSGIEGGILTNNADTFGFLIPHSGDAFFATLEALQERQVAKILAEPNIVAVSGRPAQFTSGGEIAYLVPQSLGTTTIEFKKFGTIVDFLPIVLGNGNIRLEVRPRISSIDRTLGVNTEAVDVPGFRLREVDTAVEMRAGQTFALAGLVEERVDTINRGLPYLSDIPVIGVPFRRTEDEVNEIELLIMVTPEFVDPMDPLEVPCTGPGLASTNPNNCDLYCAGHVEVPLHRNPISGPYACNGNCGVGHGGCANGHCNCHGHLGGHQSVITDGVSMPGGVGYDVSGPDPVTISDEPGSRPSPAPRDLPEQPSAPMRTMPDDLPLPADEGPSIDGAFLSPLDGDVATGGPQYVPARSYSPPRQPTFVRERSNPNNPYSGAIVGPTSEADANGLFGPVGYDAE